MEEDSSESCINLNFNQDEEPKDVVVSHVGLHKHPITANGEEEVAFSYKSDSLALLSINRYARKIKSFLGWENIIEESEKEEEDENNFTAETSSLRKYSHQSNGEVLNAENNNCGKLIKDRSSQESNGESFCDDYTLEKDNSCADEILEQQGDGSLKNSRGNYESDFNLIDDSIENNHNQETFRTEIRIIVDDCRNTVTSSTSASKINLVLESDTPDTCRAMDESLIQENECTDTGLYLNSVEMVLGDESDSILSLRHDAERSNSEGDCDVDKTHSVIDSHDDVKDKNDSGASETENNNSTKDSASIKDVINEDLLGTVTEQTNDNGELIDRKKEPNENGKDEKNSNSSEELKIALEDNTDKTGDNSSKLNKVNNVASPKIAKTLKAHIQYDNEMTKHPTSKDGTGKNIQDVNRRGSISSLTECGFSVFRPRWLQPYATVKVYVILYSIIGVLHGSYYSHLIGTLSTLEKRYAFKSKVSGTIMVADEITPLLLGVIIGYYAGNANRPRMIALGMLLSVASCICTSLPYFIYGPAQNLAIQNDTSPEFCALDLEKESCHLEDRPPTLPAVLFLVLGSFLKGFGNLAYYAIGLAYLDDNSNKRTTPIYLAIALALRLLGPLVGFLMSSIFLKFYEDPSDDPGYGPDDPRWVGAWWIGFFLQGIVLFIFTLPIALFPRRLPGQGRVEKCTTTKDESSSMKEVLMGLLAALKRLGTNPVFVLLIINTNMKIFGHFGHSIMLPKYMENQFRLSAAEASLYSGATSVTFIMLSTIFGGYLIWKFRPRLKLLLGGMIISEIILCIGLLILMIPRCQIVEMMNFGLVDEGLVLNNTCNKMCDCTTTSYTPLCGSDGITYFSPCFAGCKPDFITSVTSSKQKEYINCSCATTSAEEHSILSEGVCPDENCWSQALMYLIIYFILITLVNSFTVAHSMILLRSVHPKDKSMALGTFETFICLFGFIPFPVVFGALVDSACLVWEKSCGETGNCWFYDMHRYSYLMHGVGALFCFFSTLCLTGLYFLSSRVRDLYADEDEEKEYDDIKLDTVSGSVTKL